jgi:hypothetical protein
VGGWAEQRNHATATAMHPVQWAADSTQLPTALPHHHLYVRGYVRHTHTFLAGVVGVMQCVSSSAEPCPSAVTCAVLRPLHVTPSHTDMPELMGASMFNNLDPAQLAQLQKMAAQVGGGALGVPAIA